ncbi:MAG: LPXTG cell wall anchor domain-containing protein, partial [Oscillospiraceae bacterium]|nr:LPXTG cell wall anchor domain-containing protein [Oscillospiraceae bacterium]
PPLAAQEGYKFLGWFTGDGIQVLDSTKVWKLVAGLDELNPNNPVILGSLPQAAEAPSVQVLGSAGELAGGGLSPSSATLQAAAATTVDQTLYAKWEKIDSPSTGDGPVVDPPNPPKPLFPDLGDGLGWVLSALGVLAIGTGAVTTVGGLSIGALGLLAAPLTLLLNGLFKLIGRVIPIPGITPVGADPAKSKDYVLPPKTGDDTSLTFGAAMLLLLCGGALPLLIKRRKEELCEE